ncbi:cobyrinate a,c-diamide synthase [Methanospirillum hungatei]|uniref:cobyrinate a,c-diamide synthase n=1 Tax=Methanospirillum hungatei TaxID=2203 RepID=UPI0026E94782|nr:cobyrinate a,c-diamide synthase [Methanospirillum hungatei]MCA1916776.1 cobyrinate a,c-diamide synthase [Methanospirillum hungatei]
MQEYQDGEEIRFNIPRIVIAGIQSGCGKTTITRGLMAALKKRGLVVQPYKIGPDFIDPSHHTRICGRVSRNLDVVMAGEDGVVESFYSGCAGADIAVIEGVMGMYDGLDSTFGSTAHIAKILKAPLLLVIPVHGMAHSVHAIASGFQNYEPDSPLAGVILNKVGSPRHAELLKAGAKIPQFGFVPKDPSFHTKSRHLGLVMGDETTTEEPVSNIEDSCNIPEIIALASSAPPLTTQAKEQDTPACLVRIGVARDPAFCFYYQHNLELLERSGANLTYFSPMQDHLPDVDALYLGGGYPELHADLLETGPAREEIRAACDDGLPVYGECGGLLYLTEGLAGERTYRWTGVLPAEAEMAQRFQALGYSEGEMTGGTSLTPEGIEIRGHEFHYSFVTPDRDAQYAIRLTRGKGIQNGRDGMYVHETVGCYTHGWFSKRFSDTIIQAALTWKKR